MKPLREIGLCKTYYLHIGSLLAYFFLNYNMFSLVKWLQISMVGSILLGLQTSSALLHVIYKISSSEVFVYRLELLVSMYVTSVNAKNIKFAFSCSFRKIKKVLHFPKELLVGGSSLPRGSISQSDNSDHGDPGSPLLHPLDNNNFLFRESPMQESSNNNTPLELDENCMRNNGQDEDPSHHGQKINYQPDMYQSDRHYETKFYHRPKQKSFCKETTHEVQVELNFKCAQTNAADTYGDIEAGVEYHKPIAHSHSYPHIVNSIKETVEPVSIQDASHPNLSKRMGCIHIRVASI